MHPNKEVLNCFCGNTIFPKSIIDRGNVLKRTKLYFILKKIYQISEKIRFPFIEKERKDVSQPTKATKSMKYMQSYCVSFV